jgi:hypothetical protein
MRRRDERLASHEASTMAQMLQPDDPDADVKGAVMKAK